MAKLEALGAMFQAEGADRYRLRRFCTNKRHGKVCTSCTIGQKCIMCPPLQRWSINVGWFCFIMHALILPRSIALTMKSFQLEWLKRCWHLFSHSSARSDLLWRALRDVDISSTIQVLTLTCSDGLWHKSAALADIQQSFCSLWDGTGESRGGVSADYVHSRKT